MKMLNPYTSPIVKVLLIGKEDIVTTSPREDIELSPDENPFGN